MEAEWLYEVDASGETPLSRASKSGHIELAERMLAYEQEAPDPCTAPPLSHAAYFGLGRTAQALISDGADPNKLDQRGETALHIAARHGHEDIVESLLSGDSDVNVRDNMGMTPLHWTGMNGRSDIAEALVESGADADIRDKCFGGRTALDLAEMMDYGDVVQVLKTQVSSW